MRALFGRLRVLQSEFVILGTMAWAGWCLLQQPSPFDRFPHSYDMVDLWAGSEVFWGSAVLVAAGLLLLGILGMDRRPVLALWLRLAGLVGSSCFLSLVGVSFLVNFHHSIGGGALLAMSLRAFGLVLPERLR